MSMREKTNTNSFVVFYRGFYYLYYFFMFPLSCARLEFIKAVTVDAISVEIVIVRYSRCRFLGRI